MLSLLRYDRVRLEGLTIVYCAAVREAGLLRLLLLLLEGKAAIQVKSTGCVVDVVEHGRVYMTQRLLREGGIGLAVLPLVHGVGIKRLGLETRDGMSARGCNVVVYVLVDAVFRWEKAGQRSCWPARLRRRSVPRPESRTVEPW